MENNRIKPVDVASELSTSFLDYSMSVIISRALPDVRDGLKPSQRRILYAQSVPWGQDPQMLQNRGRYDG